MDIREAIGVSFSWSQFVTEMEKRGYTWKLNRKYPALKTPDMERYVRLRSLGKGYGETEIREKILRPKIQQVYGKPQVKFPKRKLTGLQKLYFSYLYRMGVLQQKPKRISYAVRSDIRKLDLRIRQMEFLQKEGITTREELAAYRTGYGEVCPSAFLGKRLWGDRDPGEDPASKDPTGLWKTTGEVSKEETYRTSKAVFFLSVSDGSASAEAKTDFLCGPFRYPKTGSPHPADGVFAKRRDHHQGRAGSIPETFGGTGTFLDEGTKDAIPKRSRWYAHSGDQQGIKRTSEKDPFKPADRSPVERDGRTIQEGKGTGTGTGNVRETTKGRRTEAVRR